MNTEIQSIIRNLENILTGQPWYGRPVLEILREADESKVHIKPNGTEHSMLELLWHMNTWAECSLKQLENATPEILREIEAKDWREINPTVHTWKKGMEELQTIHEKIKSILESKEDEFLSQTAPGRKFNYRFMLNGLIQHNIYHLGQIAYVKKMLDKTGI